MSKKRLRVVSACSGLCSESFALKAMGIEHGLILAAEQKKCLRDFIRQNHNPRILARDVCSPGFHKNGANADLMVAGCPCQPWSAQGSNLGEKDYRGGLFPAMVKWSRKHRPRAIILENVTGLARKHKATLEKLVKALKSIKRKNRKGKSGCYYDVQWTVLNSKFFGVPQAGI